MKYFLRPYTVEMSRVPKRAQAFAALFLAAAAAAGGSARANAQSLQVAVALEQPTLFLLHSHAQGFLGVDVGDIDQDKSQTLHLKDTRGAEITILDHDAPAGKYGLKLHDVILEINGQTIENAEQVKQMLHAMPPGRKLQLVFSRDGVEQKITVQLADRRKVQEEALERLGTLGAADGGGNSFVSNGGAGDIPSGSLRSPFGSSLHVGAMVEPLTPQTADFLGVTGGVLIKSVARKSAADAAGLRAHDVVLAIGGETVATTSDWERLLRSSEGKPVQVEIFRDREKQLVLLQMKSKKH
jgi:serine protease Do